MVRRLRWWHLVVASAVLLLAGWLALLVLVERSNRSAYRRMQQDLERAGLVTDPEAWVLAIPPGDASALAAWTSSGPELILPPPVENWLDDRGPDPGEPARAAWRAAAPGMAPAEALLDAGRLTLGVAGLARSSQPIVERLAWTSDTSRGWRRADQAARWLRLDARCADQALPALRRLDALADAAAMPRYRVDLMFGLRILEHRDRAWLTAAQQGRVIPVEAGMAGARSDDLAAWTAAAFAGDRMLTQDSIERFLSGSGMARGPTATDELWALLDPRHQWQWATTPAGLSEALLQLARNEAGLRGLPPLAADSGIGGPGNAFAQIALPDVRAILTASAQHATASRQRRLALRIIGLGAARGALPADAAECAAWLGDPGAFAATATSTAIAYRSGPGRNGFTLTAVGAQLVLPSPPGSPALEVELP